MKHLIKEAKRMQQLAGILKEFVDEPHPDDEKMDRIDMLLTRYVGEVLGTEDYDANDPCIGPKWSAIAEEFMKKDLKDITDHPIKDAIKAANFEECLRGSQLDEFGGYGFKEPNSEDIDFVVANRNTDAFMKAFSPMERLDMKGLNDEELRTHIKANIDKDDLEDARAYMEQIMQQG